MDAVAVCENFLEEQNNLNRYLEFLLSKTAVAEKDVQQLIKTLSEYQVANVAYNRIEDNPNNSFTVQELETLILNLEAAKSPLTALLFESEAKLMKSLGEQVTEIQSDLPSDFNNITKDVFTLFLFPKYPDFEKIEELRFIAIEKLTESNPDKREYYLLAINNVIEMGRSIWEINRFMNLEAVNKQISNLHIAHKMLTTNTEINVYRQCFIFLMTLFDASVFDLVRTAMRKNFFSLIGIFGKNEKLSLDYFEKFATFEEFRDAIIEEQIRSKYLKDILLLLEAQKVQMVDSTQSQHLIQIIEMVQRRNIHVHNRGIVDERYMERHHNGSVKYNIYDLQLGSLAVIDEEYWKRANNLCRNCIINITKWIEEM